MDDWGTLGKSSIDCIRRAANHLPRRELGGLERSQYRSFPKPTIYRQCKQRLLGISLRLHNFELLYKDKGTRRVLP